MSLEDFLRSAKEAALIGGIILKENYRKVKEKSIEEKAEKDFVSYVDRTSEERIRDFLSRKFPDHQIVGEEEGQSGSGEYRWYIDPLDGTKNYIGGFPIFGVSVGLVRDEEPLVGAVYLPVFDTLYWAAKGMGAFRNSEPIRVSQTKNIKYSVIAYGFPSRSKRDLNVYWKIFREVFDKAAAMRRPGAAAVDLCFVADGSFGGLIEFELNPWDISAGIVILKEAGGSYKLSKGLRNRTDIIASNGHLQRYLEETVYTHLED